MSMTLPSTLHCDFLQRAVKYREYPYDATASSAEVAALAHQALVGVGVAGASVVKFNYHAMITSANFSRVDEQHSVETKFRSSKVVDELATLLLAKLAKHKDDGDSNNR
ncbi:hypothetical protein PI126_g4045 [Phytophthora idaei]|nr:hypothetical protein PI126_g4045 [Phytophthora idaei]